MTGFVESRHPAAGRDPGRGSCVSSRSSYAAAYVARLYSGHVRAYHIQSHGDIR
jgi:hypothetical protein